jgi:hypothetical protein
MFGVGHAAGQRSRPRLESREPALLGKSHVRTTRLSLKSQGKLSEIVLRTLVRRSSSGGNDSF